MFVEPMLLCTNSLNGHATQKARVLTNFTCTQDFRSSEPYNQLALSSFTPRTLYSFCRHMRMVLSVPKHRYRVLHQSYVHV